jgi:hypothetical protein
MASLLLAYILLHLQIKYPFLCTEMILLAEIQILRDLVGWIQLFGKLNPIARANSSQ